MNAAEDNSVRLIREVVPGMIVAGMEITEIDRAPRMVSKSDLSSLFRCKICYFNYLDSKDLIFKSFVSTILFISFTLGRSRACRDE